MMGERSRIGWAIKLPYTAFVAVLVPFYWVGYGPDNFLWFSDVALLTLVAALWLENRLLFSMMAVAVLLPELAWLIDFVVTAVLGVSFGIAGYMFDPAQPLHLRVLSGFHFFLPPLMLWGVWRLGYDRRAFLFLVPLTWALLLASYLLADPSRNINWVQGFGTPPYRFLPGPLHLALLMAGLPLLVQLPTHFILLRLFARR